MQKKHVIPVLVKNARMPDFSQLPDSIDQLQWLNSAVVRRTPDLENDCKRLADGIKAHAKDRIDSFEGILIDDNTTIHTIRGQEVIDKLKKQVSKKGDVRKPKLLSGFFGTRLEKLDGNEEISELPEDAREELKDKIRKAKIEGNDDDIYPDAMAMLE